MSRRRVTSITPEEERQVLQAIRNGESRRALERRFHRCGKTIRAIAAKHGIGRTRTLWTADDKARLRRIYPDLPASQVAELLGRSIESISGQAAKLGLRKSATYLASPDACRLRRGDDIGKAFRFPPGHVPANKGTRRPGWSAGRMRETQFTKGQQPGNTLPVGTVRANADGYLRIKISDAPEPPGARGANSPNWEFVHRRVWEAAHGPIPEGYRIWWKDGDHQNCVIENLELLSAQEHMARTTIHNLPPELKEVVQLKGALNRAITWKEKANAKKQAGRPTEPSVRNAGSLEG